MEVLAGVGAETWKRVRVLQVLGQRRGKGWKSCMCWVRDMEKGGSPAGVGSETWKRVGVLQVLGQRHGKGESPAGVD